MLDLTACVFCDILAGEAPATIVRSWPTAIAIKPLNPVTEGHTLIIPATHVRDVTEDPEVSAMTMEAAAEYAAGVGPCNVITSAGREATQTVPHLHLHVVPRKGRDGLALPWTPNASQERAEQAEARLSRAHALAERLAAEGEERASQAVTAEQAAAWKTQAHIARLLLAALDTDPGCEPASPRHTRAEEEK